MGVLQVPLAPRFSPCERNENPFENEGMPTEQWDSVTSAWTRMNVDYSDTHI